MGYAALCSFFLMLLFLGGPCSALNLQGKSGEANNDPYHNWCKSANHAACDKNSQIRMETWNKAMETRFNNCKKVGNACDFGEMQPSGPGSSLEATKGLRPWLRQVFDITGARSVLDVPCGDLTWMPHVNMSGIEYVGGDISADIVEYNNKKLVDDNRFSGRICLFDIICEVAPKGLVDLIISRDVLFHLPTKDAVKALQNFEASGAKFLVSTTYRHNRGEVQHYDPKKNEYAYTDTSYSQSDAVIGHYNIDLFAPPFCLPDPPLAEHEEGDGTPDGRRVVLWQLPALNTSTSKACKEFRASV